MKKGILILIISVALILAVLGLLFVRAGSPEAKLIITKGIVQVDSGKGYVNAQSGMILKQGYSVKTLESSSANILIYESSIMRMNENTEIKIDFMNTSSMSFQQKTGQTWTKLLKMSGISDYSIETPDAVATVRGTAFAVTIGNSTIIDVLLGLVNADSGNSSIDVNANSSASASNGSIEVNPLTRTDWINENDLSDQAFITELKSRLKSKYSTQIALAKLATQVTDEDIDKLADDYIGGRLSIKAELEKGNVPGAVIPLIPEELKRY